MNAAKLGRFAKLWPPIIARMVEPTLPFAQMRHRRLGRRVEGAPAALAAEPRQSRLCPQAMIPDPHNGDSLGPPPAMAARAQRIRTAAAPGGKARLPRCFRAGFVPAPIRLQKRRNRLPPLLCANPAIAASHPEKSSARIESTRACPSQPTHNNTNVIRAKGCFDGSLCLKSGWAGTVTLPPSPAGANRISQIRASAPP